MRRKTVRLGALMIAVAIAMPAIGVSGTPVLAATASAFVLDRMFADSSIPSGADHVIQAFHDPGDATINAWWTGSELAFNADPAEGSLVAYSLGSGTDAAFSVGTFNAANVNGCTGTVTIHELEPALELNVTADLTTLSASFERACGSETTFGEIRFHSDDPYAALGATHSPGHAWHLLLSGAGESFVGRRTEPSTVTLKNLGTIPLTLGALAFDPAPKAAWTISANSCTGSLAPGATCAITGTAVAWVPGWYADHLTLPVSTERGVVRINATSGFAAARFVPIDPIRLVDTRVGLGISSSLKTGVARTFTVINRFPADEARNIPADAVAVTGNLVLTKTTTSGYGALTTTASNNPSIRTLYLPAGDTRGNGVITRLSEQGKLGLTWLGGAGSSAHAIFEATGYFVPTEATSGLRSGNFRGHSPWRLVNTSTGQGISSRLVAGQPRTFAVPLVGVDQESTAVVGVVTVLTPKQGGYLSIGASPVAAPKTAVLHFRANESRTNSLIAKLGSSSQARNTLSVTYVGPAGSSVDVLFDVHGTFGSGQSGFVPLVPNRVVDSAAGIGMSQPVPARTKRVAGVVNRFPNDPSRNVPSDVSTGGTVLFKGGIVGNLWMMRPTATGLLGAVPPGVALPPATWAIRAPAGDRRAFGLVLGTANSGVGVTLYYSAGAGASTHVIFDVTGYFITL